VKRKRRYGHIIERCERGERERERDNGTVEGRRERCRAAFVFRRARRQVSKTQFIFFIPFYRFVSFRFSRFSIMTATFLFSQQQKSSTHFEPIRVDCCCVGVDADVDDGWLMVIM